MRYLRRARDAAEARGYLSCPEVQALQGRVPGWFQALGTDSGAAEFEARRAIRLPAALREFYRCTPLACFVEAAIDGEVVLNALGEIVGPDLPPVVAWPTKSVRTTREYSPGSTTSQGPLRRRTGRPGPSPT